MDIIFAMIALFGILLIDKSRKAKKSKEEDAKSNEV